MFRTKKLYTCMAVVLAVICVIFLSNCGGGGNSSVVPNTNPTTENPVSYTNPTPTPVLSNVNVSGYLYVNNTVTEDGEIVPSISVLDVPACQSDSSGNESFLTQFSNSIKADYPEDWAKADVQELYAQLNKTLSESKPLPEYNAQAQVCSAYDDTSIPIGSDGHFDNTVLTGATDSNVKLEVALGEENYAEVETLPSSGSINSSDATSAAVLKSCPEKIFAFPGEIIIFKVYAEPGINLKSAGLKFALNNPSIGCITQPVYLCLFGAYKYQVAYGCVYIKPGLDTPVDTTITARLNSGQSMNIFLEVIKKTASVSGTVYTGGSTLVKGYVKSLGPKACCKIDASGNYTLPKVFQGHSRSVIATWWTSENGQKVRHREEKVIDFLNTDVNGFYFGVPPTPTPTSTPSATPTLHEDPLDPYYDSGVSKVINQFNQWAKESGTKEAIQKTVQWLNREIEGPPLPEEIKAASTDMCDSYEFWVLFTDGWASKIRMAPMDYYDGTDDSNSIPKANFESLNIQGNIQASESHSVNNKILILGINTYENQRKEAAPPPPFPHTVYGELADDLDNQCDSKGKKKYEVTRKLITENDIDWTTNEPNYPVIDPNGNIIKVSKLSLKNSSFPNKIISPYDLEHLGQYGVVYIGTHGIRANSKKHRDGAFDMGVVFHNNGPITVLPTDPPTYSCSNKTEEWMLNHRHDYVNPWNIIYLGRKTWIDHYQCSAFDLWKSEPTPLPDAYYFHHIFLTPNFFKQQEFPDTIIFMATCWSTDMNITQEDILDGFINRCNTYIGFSKSAGDTWSQLAAYYYFYYMMYGFKQPVIHSYPYTISDMNSALWDTWARLNIGQETKSLTPPFSTFYAAEKLATINLKIDQNKYDFKYPLYLQDKEDMENCELQVYTKNKLIFFPAPIDITVGKKSNKK